MSVLLGTLAMAATLCVASTASAERPTYLLELRRTDHSGPNIMQFERTDGFRASHGGALGPETHKPTPHHTELIGEVRERPAPRWPTAADTRHQITPPVVVMGDQRRDDPRNELAWGLAGTGASIFTGAVLYHIETRALRQEYEQLSAGPHNARYREIRDDVDQARKFVLTLYAVGGSMLTSGVVLMANDERGGPTAKLSPAWMNGGPAARLKIKF